VATFHIPDDDREGFAALRDLADDSFNQTLLAFENNESDYSSIKNVTPQQIERLFDTVTSANFVRASADVPLDKFVDDVCESLVDSEPAFFQQTDEKKFRERASRIFSVENLFIYAKALILRNEHERQFCRARIFSDIRPVYSDDPKAHPSAVVITHTLKIEYHGAGGKLHELHLGISPESIAKLADVLTRAKDKNESLRDALAETDLTLIDPDQREKEEE
jgi:hypothetical protein